MQAFIQQAIAEFCPTALVIDFRGLAYEWGDWIVGPALRASNQLGKGRVCVVAAGETGKALASLWDRGLNSFVPLMSDLHQACTYLSIREPDSGAQEG
jgi:hypothetical protein